MKKECQQTLEYVLDPAGKKKGQVKPPCRDPDTLEKVCQPTCHFESVEIPLPPSSAIPEYTKHLSVPPEPKPTVCSPESKPGDQRNDRTTRFCPNCLNDLSWMPKYACCPKCGAKPMLVKKEGFRTPTADEIINEYLSKKKKTTDCEDPCENFAQKKAESKAPDCQCTCKGLKLCAHCRVREMVADLNIFRKKTEPEIKGKFLVKRNISQDYCLVFEKPQLSRPFLERVFSELRDLYDMKGLHSPSMNDGKLPPAAKPEPISPVLNSLYGRPTEKKPRSPKNRKKFISKHHRHCANRKHHVSRSHGWAWNLTCEARKHGWRPGAILRPLKRIMEHFLDHSKTPPKICKAVQDSEDQRVMPTLNMCKKNGAIYITLRPINNSNIEMKPIVFRVVKSKQAVALTQIKRALKDRGFTKCTCHQTVMMCVCRSLPEKKKLEAVLRSQCKQHGIQNCVDQLILTDTSESEPEFDFNINTPAASAKPCLAVKARKLNQCIQTSRKTANAASMYPVKLNPYRRAYDCAAGDRYNSTAFGAPGEEIFEDGIFGFGGGGPHGVSAAPGGRGKPPGVWGSGAGGPMRGGGRDGGGVGSRRGGGPGGYPADGSGPFGGKNFPGNKLGKDENRPPAPLIPVRMTKKYYKKLADDEKARKEKIKADLAIKKQGVNLIDYLENKGTVPKAWDPNNPRPKNAPPKPKCTDVGPDGLTAAQRRRRELLMGPCPPLDHMPRLGKCPGNCYNPCRGQVCYNCFNNYYC